jgi:transcription elongation GreA/GreB family factor
MSYLFIIILFTIFLVLPIGIAYLFYQNIDKRLAKIEAALSRLKLSERHTEEDEEDEEEENEIAGENEEENEGSKKELIGLGSIVKVRYLKEDKVVSFHIVATKNDTSATSAEIQNIFYQKPLAASLIGQTVGAIVKIGDLDTYVEILAHEWSLPDDEPEDTKENDYYVKPTYHKWESKSIQSSRIGAYVRDTLPQVISAIDRYELARLQRFDYSKETFDIQYPFLRKKLVNETKIKRYWKTPVRIHGDDYFVCSEWFETTQNNDRPYYESWLRRMRGKVN